MMLHRLNRTEYLNTVHEVFQANLMDVARLAEEMLALLKVSVSKHAALKTDLPKDLPAIRGKAPQCCGCAVKQAVTRSSGGNEIVNYQQCVLSRVGQSFPCHSSSRSGKRWRADRRAGAVARRREASARSWFEWQEMAEFCKFWRCFD